jgi:hypothetical protein
MVREFKFFRGYVDDLSININWDEINRINDLTQLPTWTPGTTYQPTWITNPGYIVPQPYTITTTPGSSGTITIPYMNGTTTTGFSLTTSNPNGTTYTTGGMGGTLTTGTQLFTNTGYSTTGTLTTSTFK